MLLAIDVGNTNVKFALVQGLEIKTRWRVATDARRTADQYAVWLTQLLELEGYQRSDVEDVVISTVVPRALHNLQLLADKYFGVDAKVAGRAPFEWGIALDVPQPSSVGADRAVNAIAAHAGHAGDLITISFGTATTFDHIAANGAYKGGIIAPGLNLSLDALVSAAAKLPRIAIEAPTDDSVIGNTTEGQMLIGIYWGYVGLVEGIVRQIRIERDRPMKVIGTGGLASLFEQGTDVFESVEDDLTMHGLVLIHNYNKELGNT